MMTTTYADLMAASGMLNRAAHYLFTVHGAGEAAAVGTLLGLAFYVRPQLVK